MFKITMPWTDLVIIIILAIGLLIPYVLTIIDNIIYKFIKFFGGKNEK